MRNIALKALVALSLMGTGASAVRADGSPPPASPGSADAPSRPYGLFPFTGTEVRIDAPLGFRRNGILAGMALFYNPLPKAQWIGVVGGYGVFTNSAALDGRKRALAGIRCVDFLTLMLGAGVDVNSGGLVHAIVESDPADRFVFFAVSYNGLDIDIGPLLGQEDIP